jgi:hypothetical protein
MNGKNVEGKVQILFKVRRLLGRDSNSEPPKCEAEVLTTPSPYYMGYCILEWVIMFYCPLENYDFHASD